jgi:type VI secretion system secreted protein VgrG
MALFSQAARPMSLTTPLGQDALLLEELHGTEAVSELFHFRLDLLADAGTPVPFEKVLGQKVTVALAMPDGGHRYINGLVNRFSEGGQVPGTKGKPTFTRYRAEVVPQLWLWTKKVRSRIFQQKSVPDILKEVLAGLDVDFRLQGQYPERDYCVQYQESDFAFACRLMEDEGICYFFSHRDGGHTLVLADDPQGHPYVPGPSRLHFEPVAGEVRPDDRVVSWEKTQELRAGKCTVWDYAFEMPPKNLGASAPPPDSVRVGAVAHALRVGRNDELELYDCPGGYARWVDAVGPAGGYQPSRLGELFAYGERVAGLRMQEETAAALVATGESTCRQLTAGHKFALDRHGGGDGTYVLTRVEHAASLRGAYTSDARRELEYHNHFACAPLDLPCRPARSTPRPRVAGVQTAVVVGPSGQDVFTDKYGRIKVQFFWDRQAKNRGTTRNGSSIVPLQYWRAGGDTPSSSCWVRVAQSWAGRGWGGMVIPRLGQEVVIAFEEGDPDRPLCVGCVYNELNQPPLPLPERAMDTALKTSSVGGDAPNYSGLAFHDELGEEHLQLHSERDLTIMAEQHKVVNVGVNHHVNVGNTHMTTVGALPAGSGGGGGGDVTYNGAFNWLIGNKDNPDIKASVGKSLQLVYGEQVAAVAGLSTRCVVGFQTDLVINPLAIAMPLLPTLVQAVAAPLAGECHFRLGAFSTITYGQTLTMNRGPEIKLTGPPSVLTVGLAGAAALLGTASVLTAGGLDPDTKAGEITDLSLVGGFGLALIALTASEVYDSVKELTTLTTAEAAAAEAAKNLGAMKGAIKVLQTATQDAAGDTITLQDSMLPIQNALRVVNNAYALQADTISETSDSGTLLSAGAGNTECLVSLDPGAMGTGQGLLLRQCSPAAPWITLNSNGIAISVGTPIPGMPPAPASPRIYLSQLPNQGLTLGFGMPGPTYSFIRLNDQGITLSYGPPGVGCSITLGAAGITLQVGATTSLKLKADQIASESLQIEATALNKYAVNAGELEEAVIGAASRLAASQMMEAG